MQDMVGEKEGVSEVGKTSFFKKEEKTELFMAQERGKERDDMQDSPKPRLYLV